MLSKDKIGLKYPTQLDGKGGLASFNGLDLEKADNLLLLGIERGELPWDMNEGTKIRELMHGKVSNQITADSIAFREATDVIETYNPRFRVTATKATFTGNMVRVSVQYVERVTLNPEPRVVTLEVNR